MSMENPYGSVRISPRRCHSYARIPLLRETCFQGLFICEVCPSSRGECLNWWRFLFKRLVSQPRVNLSDEGDFLFKRRVSQLGVSPSNKGGFLLTFRCDKWIPPNLKSINPPFLSIFFMVLENNMKRLLYFCKSLFPKRIIL